MASCIGEYRGNVCCLAQIRKDLPQAAPAAVKMAVGQTLSKGLQGIAAGLPEGLPDKVRPSVEAAGGSVKPPDVTITESFAAGPCQKTAPANGKR